MRLRPTCNNLKMQKDIVLHSKNPESPVLLQNELVQQVRGRQMNTLPIPQGKIVVFQQHHKG